MGLLEESGPVDAVVYMSLTAFSAVVRAAGFHTVCCSRRNRFLAIVLHDTVFYATCNFTCCCVSRPRSPSNTAPEVKMAELQMITRVQK